jgi:hypothetical protein
VWRKHGVEWDEWRCDLGRKSLFRLLFLCFSTPFYPLVNRDHSDSIVYIDRAWIARINVESSSLNTIFSDAIFFLIANINSFSTHTLVY